MSNWGITHLNTMMEAGWQQSHLKVNSVTVELLIFNMPASSFKVNNESRVSYMRMWNIPRMNWNACELFTPPHKPQNTTKSQINLHITQWHNKSKRLPEVLLTLSQPMRCCVAMTNSVYLKKSKLVALKGLTVKSAMSTKDFKINYPELLVSSKILIVHDVSYIPPRALS